MDVAVCVSGHSITGDPHLGADDNVRLSKGTQGGTADPAALGPR
jgi:hypothetical protein